MYNWFVRRRVRSVWSDVGEGRYDRAVELAVDDIEFDFAGTTPLSAHLRGREGFRAWFAALFERFPGISLTVLDVVSTGWPWATTVAVRLSVDATLRDGSRYHNEAVQWLNLRWGRLVADWVLEDTQALDEACWIQAR